MFAHSALIARVCMLQTRTPTSLANIQTISNTRKLATKSEQTSQRKTERKLKRRGRREEGGGVDMQKQQQIPVSMIISCFSFH